MREIVGDSVAVIGVAFGIYCLVRKMIEWKAFTAIALSVIILGVVVSGMSRITQLDVKGGKVGEVNLHLQEQVQHVDTKASEVEALDKDVKTLKGQTESLANAAKGASQQIQDDEKRIKADETNIANLVQRATETGKQVAQYGLQAKNALTEAQTAETHVSKMEGNVQQSFRSIFEANAYALGTRNIFPFPAAIGREIDQRLNVLATFAYPDITERRAVFQRLTDEIRGAQPQIPNPATPH